MSGKHPVGETCSPQPLPPAFLARMERLLGEEYPAFLEALSAPPVRGIRANGCKIRPDALCHALPFPLVPLSYASDGFLCQTEEKVGSHPLHHAGGFYVQDPGAMATVCAASVRRGMRVLDCCAAPGGKTSQLCALVGDEGVVVANEISLSRCRTLLGNLERLGCRNAVVTNTDTATLSGWFDRYFDFVLADAPCSGEGMFRKYDFAAGEWDEDAPARCALRQRDILQNAARTVRPGGYLLYSTCTFSPEENEQTVETFLTEHPDFVLCPVAEPVAQVTAPGIGLPLARRFYPHLAPGEGQFLALLRRSETAAEGRGICYTTSARPLSAADRKTVETFLTDTLATDRLPCTLGESVAFLPMPGGEAFPVPPRFVMSAGVTVGRLEKGRLTPHHQLFSALGHAFFRQTEWWGAEERLLAAYLHGEGFQVRQDNGWGCVLVRGCALGGYKAVDGMAKNHYPKGLRI